MQVRTICRAVARNRLRPPLSAGDGDGVTPGRVRISLLPVTPTSPRKRSIVAAAGVHPLSGTGRGGAHAF